MLTIDQFETVLQFATRLAARMDPQSRVAIETLCAAIEAQAIPRPFESGARPEHANSWFAIETLETIAERSADPATRSGACLLMLLITGANFLESRPFGVVSRTAHESHAPAAARRNRRAPLVESIEQFMGQPPHVPGPSVLRDVSDDSGES